MGFYRTKWIKGNQYLYYEERYRAGGKVQSRSTYCGAVGGGGSSRAVKQGIDSILEEINQASNSVMTRAEISKAGNEVRDRLRNLVKNPPKTPEQNQSKSKPSLRKKSTPTPKAKPEQKQTHKKIKKRKPKKEHINKNLFQSKVNLGKHKINPLKLLNDQKAANEHLQMNGINLDLIPKITIETRWFEVGHSKNIFGSGYTVYIPKYGIPSKAKFYSEFRKTVLKASLDAIQDQKPEAYKNLKNGFKESYKTTQTYLKRFILHTNDKDKEIKASQVQGVFASGHLPKLKINRLSPKSLGLVDDSVRASWRDDLVAVLSDLTDRGAPTVSKERQRELKRAERELETATKEHESCKGFFKNPVKKDRARKREARAYYRLELNKEMLKKLELIKKYYA